MGLINIVESPNVKLLAIAGESLVVVASLVVVSLFVIASFVVVIYYPVVADWRLSFRG